MRGCFWKENWLPNASFERFWECNSYMNDLYEKETIFEWGIGGLGGFGYGFCYDDSFFFIYKLINLFIYISLKSYYKKQGG